MSILISVFYIDYVVDIYEIIIIILRVELKMLVEELKMEVYEFVYIMLIDKEIKEDVVVKYKKCKEMEIVICFFICIGIIIF